MSRFTESPNAVARLLRSPEHAGGGEAAAATPTAGAVPASSSQDAGARLHRPRRIVVGIGGASGAAYAQRVVEELVTIGVEVHLVITANGVRMLADELGIPKSNLDLLAGKQLQQSDKSPAGGRIVHYNINDTGACLASGSFLHDGMIVVPCSSSGLGMIAAGIGANLLYRAAFVTMKERRRLVICHREMPLAHLDIDNMHRLSVAGAILAPANPGFYFVPKTVEEIVDFVAARLLDLVGITDHGIGKRWGEDPFEPARPIDL